MTAVPNNNNPAAATPLAAPVSPEFAAKTLASLVPDTIIAPTVAMPLSSSIESKREAALSRLREAESLRRRGMVDPAIAIAQQVISDASIDSDAETVAIAETSLANYHRYVPNPLVAIQLLNRAEAWFRRHGHHGLAKAIAFKGMVLSDLGDHTRALDLYRQALTCLDHQPDHDDPVLEATINGSIGVAFTQLGEFAEAEAAYLKAMATYVAHRNHEGIGYLLNNLAILRVRSIQALDRRATVDGAGAEGSTVNLLMLDLFRFVDQGLTVNRQHVESLHLEALLLNTRGDGLRALGRPAEALPDIEKSLGIYRVLGLARGMADVTADMGAALLELGRLDDALAHLESGIEAAISHELKDHQRRLRRMLSEAYERKGDAATALAEYKVYHKLERDLHDRETQKRIQQIALREEIDRSLDEAREQAEKSAQLSAENAVLQKQTERLDRIAYEDSLTGLANRRRFDERTRAMTDAPPATFAIAVCDIDYFKRINDRWSHATGDAVLKEVGAILRAHAREHDLVARFGGEEFVLAMQQIDGSDAFEACERVRAAIERHPWHMLQPDLKVTISIGYALGDGHSAVDALLAVADERLYESKHGGRNRVTGPQLAVA